MSGKLFSKIKDKLRVTCIIKTEISLVAEEMPKYKIK
jgi:hypothetical protein